MLEMHDVKPGFFFDFAHGAVIKTLAAFDMTAGQDNSGSPSLPTNPHPRPATIPAAISALSASRSKSASLDSRTYGIDRPAQKDSAA